MIVLPNKAKQYLLVTLKVFVLGLTFGIIYQKLTDGEGLTLSQFLEAMTGRSALSTLWILVFLTLAAINWSLEVFKWKTVVSTLRNISFREALKQSLAALTLSLATPGRIGDYGAKALFYPPGQRKQVLLLNFVVNSTQMFITVLFGVLGLIVVGFRYSISFSGTNLAVVAIVVALTVSLGYALRNKEFWISGFSVSNVLRKLKIIPSVIWVRTLALSAFRYLVFTQLFCLLLYFFGVQLNYANMLFLVSSMYLLVSLAPTFLILDVVVRGGVAVWLFSLAGIPELPVLCTVLTMWLLNFGLPALWGSYYVATFNAKHL